MSKKEMSIKRIIHGSILIFFIIALAAVRHFPHIGEWYACRCYPVISAILSAISSVFPFSLGDCMIVAGCIWLVIYPFYAWSKRKPWKQTLWRVLVFCCWIYIWFYVAWGINYFRLPFYERMKIRPVSYEARNFNTFLDDYIKGLNNEYENLSDTSLYVFREKIAASSVREEIIRGYEKVYRDFSLIAPFSSLKPKPMLCSRGMSMVGVTGYMGPFVSEFNLNTELLNVEYPFTLAHEMAHRLNIAGEAEANLLAYVVTLQSSCPEVRFSGYFSLMPYIMSNARRLLPEDDYAIFFQKIHPEILSLYKRHRTYWQNKYYRVIGSVQNKVYNLYLKSNQIKSGTQNYSEVVGLLLSLWEDPHYRTMLIIDEMD